MKKLSLVMAAIFLALPLAAFAQEVFGGCELETRVDDRSSGRFIWKERGAHFNQAVIVAPRYYFPVPPLVELFVLDGEGKPRKIERARLKSTGNCSWHPECLFAATYLTQRNGQFYKRKYGSVYVRITPGGSRSSTKECRSYFIRKPQQRAAFKG